VIVDRTQTFSVCHGPQESEIWACEVKPASARGANRTRRDIFAFSSFFILTFGVDSSCLFRMIAHHARDTRGASLAQGLRADLADAHRLIGPAVLALEAPRTAMSAVFGSLAPMFLNQGQALYLVDGVNCFDPYAFSGQARMRQQSEDILDRVFVSRAFTIHQLAAAVHMMQRLADRSPPPVLGVLGLDHLFLEETLRQIERRRVLGSILAELKQLCGRGARMLVTYETPPRGQSWWQPMLEFGDAQYRLTPQEDGGWKVLPRRQDRGKNRSDIQHLLTA